MQGLCLEVANATSESRTLPRTLYIPGDKERTGVAQLVRRAALLSKHRYALLLVRKLGGKSFLVREGDKESIECVVAVFRGANLGILLRCRWMGWDERHGGGGRGRQGPFREDGGGQGA